MFSAVCNAMGAVGWLVMLGVWGSLIALAVWAVTRLFPHRPDPGPARKPDDASPPFVGTGHR